MAYLFQPTLTRLVLDPDGAAVPAVGYKSYFFAAGTSTPVTTWADASESEANAHPVVHDAGGTALVYFSGSVKWEFRTPDGDMVDGWPIDGIDAPVTVQQEMTAWVDSGLPITRIDDVTFRVSGDYTALFQATRRVLARGVSEQVAGSILASWIDSGYTFVLIRGDSGNALPVSIVSVDVGILEADPYAGPAPSTNTDLVLNPHFYGWPQGTHFDVSANNPSHYGADCWKLNGPPGTGELGTGRLITDRVLPLTDEISACGSRYAVQIQCSRVSGTIWADDGDSNISYLQGQRLYDAIPWMGQRCVMEVWAHAVTGTYQVNPWIGFYTDRWNLVRGEPIILTYYIRRFVTKFILPNYSELAGTISDSSSFFIGLDLYRGSANPETSVLYPKPFSAFNLYVYAIHMRLDEDFGRILSYDDALDQKRRERYFYSSYPDGVAPGTANTDAPIMLTAASTTDAYGNIRWPMQMSKLPNVWFYAPQAGTMNRLERVSTGEVAGADISSARFDRRGVSYIVSGAAALTAGEAYRVHVVADARY